MKDENKQEGLTEQETDTNNMSGFWDYYNNIASAEPYRGKRTGTNNTKPSDKKKRKAKNRLQKQARKKNRQ